MSTEIYSTFRQCIVKLKATFSNGIETGTGFFVAPQLILTCRHVVKNDNESIKAYWQNNEYEVDIHNFEDGRTGLSNDKDIAVLKLRDTTLNHPCVYLGKIFNPGDGLYSFGYGKKLEGQDNERSSLIAKCEGPDGTEQLFTFKADFVRPGFSGAPLLNQKTGEVCGLIKSERSNKMDTDGKSSKLRLVSGGTAITISAVFEEWPSLQDLNHQFHQQDLQWRNMLLSSNEKYDLGNAPDMPIFYGRSEEIAKLKQWIIDERDHCRLVAVLGMGGMGKTSLIVHSIKQFKDEFPAEFDYVIWRSLHSNPPLSSLLRDLIRFLSNQQENHLSDDLDKLIDLLIKYLKQFRCLLILDNFNSILAEHGSTSPYLEGYDTYGDLLKRIKDCSHKSCLLLTSREQPRDLFEYAAVRTLNLKGLSETECQRIFTSDFSLSSTDENWRTIINHYGGNPLALTIVAAGIRDLLSSNVESFLEKLHQGYFPFEDIDDLLRRHFERISDSKKEIMYWLAITQKPVSYEELQAKVLNYELKQNLFSTLQFLQGIFIIQRTQAGNYTQQPVVMEYVTKRFIERICQEIENCEVSLLNSHALIEATTRDYVRQTQVRLILKPLIAKIRDIFRSQADLENQLLRILSNIRKMSLTEGYGAGSILNFLIELDKELKRGVLKTNVELRNFSNLTIQQAYLQCVDLYDINFSNSNFIDSVFSEPLGSIFSVAFSPNGDLIAAGDANGEIHIWQVKDFQKIATLGGDSSLVWVLAFSPDSKTLASGSDDQLIRLWDVETKECKYKLRGHSGAVRAVAFSPDGNILASGGNDRQVRLWDSKTGNCINTLDGHTNAIWMLAFHPNQNSIFASGDVDGTVSLWTTAANQQWEKQILYNHEKSVCSIDFSPKGYLLASSSHDKTIRLWDINNDEAERNLEESQSHEDWIWAISFSPDNKFLASAGEDQSIKIWNIETEKCINTVTEHTHAVRGIAFSPVNESANFHKIVSGSYDQTVKVFEWDIDRRKLQCLKTWQGLASQIRSIAFSHDGKTIASCSGDRSIRLWSINFETGEYREFKKLKEHTDWVWFVTFSPDGKTLASSSDDKTIKLWNIEGDNAKLLQTLDEQHSRVRCLSFNPDGKLIVCGCNDHKLRVWKLNKKNKWELDKTLPGHKNWIWSVAFHRSGLFFASASEDRTIRLWNINESDISLNKILNEHTNMIYSVAFSADGKVLASGSGDHTVKLWDVETGKCLQTLKGHTRWVWSVSFSADGKVLASGSSDHTVKLWDISNISTANCRMTLEGEDAHTGWVRCVKFSPDGNYLASAGDDETIRLWNIQTGKCLAKLRAMGPYEGMNISNVTGLNQAQRSALKALGAVE